MNGKEITLDGNGYSAKGYLAVPEQPNARAVLVLHAWWGLNGIFKKLCDRLASAGFLAFAPDLNNGKIAQTIEAAEQTTRAVPDEQRHAVASTALDFLRSQEGAGGKPLALIGFSMGAAWALALAGERPEDIDKVVLFYGAGEGDSSRMQAGVLGHFAGNDEYEDPKYIQAMEAELQNAGLKITFHTYPDTKHWFFEDDRPEYDPQAAGLAWTRTLEFLRS